MSGPVVEVRIAHRSCTSVRYSTSPLDALECGMAVGSRQLPSERDSVFPVPCP